MDGWIENNVLCGIQRKVICLLLHRTCCCGFLRASLVEYKHTHQLLYTVRKCSNDILSYRTQQLEFRFNYMKGLWPLTAIKMEFLALLL